MAVSLSKDLKPEVKAEVKEDIDKSKTEVPKPTVEVSPTQIIIDALSTIKTKLEAQPHKHKDKILGKLKGAIELLAQN